MTSAEARLHLRYSAWASRKVIEALRTIPDAMGMLRQMGIAPPHTDLMNFYRELAASRSA